MKELSAEEDVTAKRVGLMGEWRELLDTVRLISSLTLFAALCLLA